MRNYTLLHFNVARPVGPFSIDTEEARYFFKEMRALFERGDLHDGLHWHRHGMRAADGRELSPIEIADLSTDGTGNPHIYTLAGWRSAHDLHQFVYRDPHHVENMKRLRHWVDRTHGANMVMWWADKDTRISADMAWERLLRLRTEGPTPHAFNLTQRFEPPSITCVA